MLGFSRLCRGDGEPAASVAHVACEGLPWGHRVVLCSQRVVDCSGWSAASVTAVLRPGSWLTGRATRVRE